MSGKRGNTKSPIGDPIELLYWESWMEQHVHKSVQRQCYDVDNDNDDDDDKAIIKFHNLIDIIVLYCHRNKTKNKIRHYIKRKTEFMIVQPFVGQTR